MDSSLIAKVLAPKTNGKNVIGTAYPISKDFIITACHIVDFEERDVSRLISVVWTDIADSNNNPYTVQVSQDNIVFKGGEKYDVAVIRCDVPSQAYGSLPILAKQHPVGSKRWESMGFPSAGRDENGVRHKISLIGEFFPFNKKEPLLDLFCMGSVQDNSEWGGIGGAPVFSEEVLIAIIIYVPSDFKDRLRAVSIPYLLTHEEGFSSLLLEHSLIAKPKNLSKAEDSIFLSYAREDFNKAKQLAKALENRGWSVFWDRANLLPGQDMDEVIEEAIEQASCMIVIWSKNSKKSDWVRGEATIGRERRVLIPILFEAIDPPIAFRALHTEDFVNWEGDMNSDEFIKLTRAITNLLSPK